MPRRDEKVIPNLTRIDGLDVTTTPAVVSETGTDMSRFSSDQTKRCASPDCGPPNWAHNSSPPNSQ